VQMQVSPSHPVSHIAPSFINAPHTSAANIK
jgi:hypothetical protein